jgi:DNA-binding NtrC family response regulator
VRDVLVLSPDLEVGARLREWLASCGLRAVERASWQPSDEAACFALAVIDLEGLAISAGGALERLARFDPVPPAVLLTGSGSVEEAVAAIQGGALDYLSKPLREDELRLVLLRARAMLRGEKESCSESVEEETAPSARRLLGSSPRMLEVYKAIARAAMSPCPVLIRGETGTGKELVARAIHESSPRRRARFVSLNCGALVETLLESELFGHARGAFTGAHAAKAGLLEWANGGTLFLDEIGDISPGLQLKLLRVVQEGEYRPVGSNELRRTEVRILAATHRDLERRMREGRFRPDLFYRLNVIGIALPPLRERRDDLPELIRAFVARAAARLGRASPSLSEEALVALCGHRWPGNLRELENAIEHAVALSPLPVLYPEDFPRAVLIGRKQGEEPTESPQPLSEWRQAGARAVEFVERERIVEALRRASFNKSRAADLLGISRVTLYRKVRRYAIEEKTT